MERRRIVAPAAQRPDRIMPRSDLEDRRGDPPAIFACRATSQRERQLRRVRFLRWTLYLRRYRNGELVQRNIASRLITHLHPDSTPRHPRYPATSPCRPRRPKEAACWISPGHHPNARKQAA